jgi:hypothetical protein
MDVFLLIFFILVIGLLASLVWLFITFQGDALFEFITAQRTPFVLDKLTQDTAVFSCKVPFMNKGSQAGTIMDAYTRHLLPMEQFKEAEVLSRLTLEKLYREDGYWEAVIIPKGTGGTVIVTVTFKAKSGDIRQDLSQMVDMPIDLVYQVVARSPWYIDKARIVMTSEEISQALNLDSVSE